MAAVSTVMAARDDRGFRSWVDSADLVTPDGMPLVWGLRWLGVPKATRVYGPELMPVILSRAASEDVPVAFVGGTPDVLDRLSKRAGIDFPGLRVVHRSSPFDDGTPSELDGTIADEIRESGARIVFVGLGCPKQERWMARQRANVQAVMLWARPSTSSPASSHGLPARASHRPGVALPSRDGAATALGAISSTESTVRHAVREAALRGARGDVRTV